MKERYWKRPYDDNPELEDDVAKAKLGMDMYSDLLKVNDEDQFTFSNKTSMWIAYERQLESERPLEEERLFNDKLAKHFAQPYGKDLSDAFSCMGSTIIFNPKNEIPELKTEGFPYYHAARTKLIGDYLENWLSKTTKQIDDVGSVSAQIINLGAGMDTRPFWDESLKDATLYIEVDTKEVQIFKEKVLDDIKQKNELPNTYCDRKVISMDFAIESTKDLPSHGIQFDDNKPTCWILEGLIMYLKKDDMNKMLVEISTLSPAGSFVILNFADGSPNPGWDETLPCSEYCRQLLVDNHGWKHDKTLYFGDPEFSFDRYPEGRPPNKSLGFSFYSR